MSQESETSIQELIESIYRDESRRVFATLIRVLGDFDLAEEALHDAFIAAVAQWPRQGVPNNPRAWLVSAGRFKAIDTLRRRSRFNQALTKIASDLETHTMRSPDEIPPYVEDDRLRLIFTCCHPALAADAQIALTLREVCGLTTEEIARAFLSAPATVAQRIVRAKRKIRETRIPYEVPSLPELPERLAAVLQVIYLVFNEGYSATSGPFITRNDLSAEAIRLARLLVELMPEPEAQGLLALMLLHESRRAARTNSNGDLVLLSDQDRNLWDYDLITEGSRLVRHALLSRHIGPYALQAAIAAVHAEVPDPSQTDWNEIVGLYDLLLAAEPSPVVELNRAVAVAMRDGAAAGLGVVESLLERGELSNYAPVHSCRADLCRRLGQTDEALVSYHRALELTEQEPERRFIRRRIHELESYDAETAV